MGRRQAAFSLCTVSWEDRIGASRLLKQQESRVVARKPRDAAANCIGLSRYIAIANLSITAVFVEYLRQFLIDLNQIHRHST